MGAEKVFCGLESFLAFKEFIRPSEDPIVVNGRKFCDFAVAVLGDYVQLTGYIEEGGSIGTGEAPALHAVKRTGESVIQRFKKIRKACLEF